MATISVIMTTHNGRKDKCKVAIESVLNQSYKDFELIVVDDFSQDGTDTMVEEFKDTRIIYKRRDSNYGTDTRPKNEGILLSSGKYIAFLDSDNTYRPDHLQVLVKALEEDSSLDAVYGDRFVYVDGKPIGVGTRSDWQPDMLFGQNYIDTSDILIRRECLFELGGFDERYKKFIDWNLWLRAAKCRKLFKRIPMVITDYYIDESSKSRRVEDSQGVLKPAWHPMSCECKLDYLGKKPEPKVAIYSLTYDRLELTKECFESLYKTAGYEFDHYIVDNGSKDGTLKWLQEAKLPYEWCNYQHIIPNKDNKGISIASNQALDAIKEYGGYDIIMKVDNDAYFKDGGWLKTMIKVWKVWPSIALSLYVEGLINNPGGAPRLDYITVADEFIGLTNHVGGICHFVDASAYKDFRWDESSFLHGMQDTEFSQYLAFNHFYQGYLENLYVEHRLGTKGQQEKYPDYFERRKLEKQTRYEKNK